MKTQLDIKNVLRRGFISDEIEFERVLILFRSSGFVIRSFFSRRTGFYRISATKLIQHFFFPTDRK